MPASNWYRAFGIETMTFGICTVVELLGFVVALSAWRFTAG
jgi:hypothetical protein